MPKIGDALKKAVETKPQEIEDKSRARAASPLMNENRRKIFQYLCQNPCSSIGQIVGFLDMTRSTVSWHLDQLDKSGYLDSYNDKKKKYYCPAGLVSRKSMRVFSLLNQSVGLKIYRAILHKPGLDPGQIQKITKTSSSHSTELLKKMLESGLITSIRDGRHVRYYPTEGFMEVVKEDITSQKEFIRNLLNKMNQEHLRPEVDELKGGGFVIILKLPDQTSRITIPFHPMESLVLAE